MRRELYPKHLEFFAAGRTHRERAFIAANRSGKTFAGAFETALHLTGLYPEWWQGRRFEKAIDAWAAGDTGLTTRDIIQRELLGAPGNDAAQGTGMIPGDLIVHRTMRRGVADAVDTVFVKHATGAVSALGFKSYAEGRANFQGTSKHWVWFDEEPELEVYTEALMRSMVVPGTPAGGCVILTFTPLEGWTEVIESFLGSAAQSEA